ncbi:alpha/beta hydrolase family protein [Bifidobacterium oedipodis]|uniref:Alpha/beta hydrolase n=1 Tax=Bifidobacterium oedipodis TaxID=2675322 RepID=A0A7Y0EQX3_9BIFI|nr:alpha/beta hydrolase [Bifidobacterium sp. DSM 109957]NMM94747.1 alpha/beta hydrolase [Bifidobacterium sp. DSM 109957]
MTQSHITYLEETIDGLTLRGTAHIPDGDGPFPTVLMFHGFFAVRDECFNAFVQLSSLLNMAGICAIRFDFSCHGESDGEPINFTFSHELREGTELINRIRSLDYVDESRISLLGMSLGGVAAGMVAGLATDQVNAVCMWSPAAVFGDDVPRGILAGTDVNQQLNELGHCDYLSFPVGRRFFDDFKTIDIYGVSTRFTGPVAVILGDSDETVPEHYAHDYAAAYSQPVEVTIVPKATHGWSTIPTRTALFERTMQFLTAVNHRANH